MHILSKPDGWVTATIIPLIYLIALLTGLPVTLAAADQPGINTNGADNALTAHDTSKAPTVLTLRHRQPDHAQDQRSGYFVGILRLALDKTEAEYGPYKLIASENPINQERSFMMVSHNRLDITWGMTSKMRELRTLPIRIPLMKGLLGYRVLLINKKRHLELKDVDTLDELRRHVMIQGNGWPDVDILRNNAIPVRTHTEYVGLFRMLAMNRVDFFPRSIAEVWLEMELSLSQDLKLQDGLVLQYVSPIYFFVPPDRLEVAERVRTGLEQAVTDGSFDRYIQNRPELKKALNLLNNTDYTLIKLQGPTLHPKTPLDRPELWFKPVRDAARSDD